MGSNHIIDYVQAHVSPGEKMLVYPVFTAYVLLPHRNLQSLDRYEYLMPGFHSALAVSGDG